ncbi:MAG: GyrI-like domain-containing protein [bacterium]|nr:GyrI-like domain-containing protein [bacterium]
MKSWIVLLVALVLVSTAALAVAQDEVKAEEPKTEAVAPAPVKCEMVGEMGVKTLPAMKVGALTVKAADYAPEGGYPEGAAGVEVAYEKMMTNGFTEMEKWIGAGNRPVGPSLAAYYEDPEKTSAKDLTCKIMFPIGPEAKGTEKIVIEDLPEMEAGVVQYKGPYDGSGDIWIALDKWVKENGFESAGAPMEVYLKGPGDNVPPSEYLTEIRIPVKKIEKAEPKPEK